MLLYSRHERTRCAWEILDSRNFDGGLAGRPRRTVLRNEYVVGLSISLAQSYDRVP